MSYGFNEQAVELNNDRVKRGKRKRWTGLVAMLVVLSTLYGLLVPAFTLEKPTYCGLEEHVHTDACYEEACQQPEHTHSLACYSDPNADLEDESTWTKSFPTFADETAAERFLAIAASQLGYRESAANYVVDGDDVRGYTRYGAWHGSPYGDWCAMFISFCLYYAGIDKADMPYAAGCTPWVEALKEKDLYIAKDGEARADYVPVPGDLVFFRAEDGNGSGHVGIVTAYDQEKDILTTIEGNSGDRVQEQKYDRTDSTILGYGKLPEKAYALKQSAVKNAPRREQSQINGGDSGQNGSDLRNTLASATITINGREVTGKDWTVRAGEEYTVHLKFQEVTGDAQFDAESGRLVYKLPDSFNVTGTTGGSIDFTYNTESGMQTITGCTYRYAPETKSIVVELTDEAKQRIGESGNASFQIDINGSFNANADKVKFSDTIIKNVDIDDSHDLSIAKTGYYDPKDDKIHYKLTVRSTGVSTDVNITDVISGSALTLDADSVTVSGNSGKAATTYNGNGFTTTIDQMAHGETVTIEYTASVNHAVLAGKSLDQITANDTGNTATVEGKDGPPETVTYVVKDHFDSVSISKGAGNSTVSGNTATIPWTITYNENQSECVGGTKITDTITGAMADKTKYAGEGITVDIYEGGKKVDTVKKTWAELGVTGDSKSWSYTLPDDGGHKYKYVISYTTDTDVTGQIKAVSVGNTVDDHKGHSGSGSGTGKPGEDAVSVRKTHGAVTPDTISWDVSFDVPASGLTSAVVTDTLPSVESYRDTIDPHNIEITGLLPGESYTIDVSNPEKVVITFYQDEAKTKPGLQSGENKREVVVSLTTDNDPTWIETYGDGSLWQATHKNKVELKANGEVFTAEDSAKPITTGIQKSGEPAGSIEIDGVEYPVFKYNIDIFGLSEDTKFPIQIKDTFNTSLLKFYKTDGIFIDWSGGTYSGACTKGAAFMDGSGSLQFVPTEDGFTVEIPKKAVQPYSGWALSNPRRLVYYLIVKDQDALNRLLNDSLGAVDNDYAVSLRNVATDGSSTSEHTVDYQYPAVDKSLLGVDKNSGLATYKIVLNPSKVKLNSGKTITMTDTYENLSVDFSSVRVTLEGKDGTKYGPFNTSSAQDMVTWNYRGNTGTFQIPDETKVTITYSARVTKTGPVTIKNTASMLSFSDTVSEDTHINSSGSGTLDINYIWLFKHEGGNMTKPIEGVEFTLVDANGNPVLYPATAKNGKAGQPITFTTGTRTVKNADGTESTLSGYARIFLSEQDDGMSFQKGVTYYLLETKAAEGYQRDGIRYSFTIADHPDYSKYEYHIGDVLRINNWPQEGVIEIRKSLIGAEGLTDAQKEQITFTLSGTPADGSPFETKTFNYGEFTSGSYLFEQLAPGTYTVTETGYQLGRYDYAGTTVSSENGSVLQDGRQVTFTITQADIDAHIKYQAAFENRYTEPKATSLTVKKTDSSGQLHLYNATFQILKKVGEEYKPLEEAEGETTGAFGENSTFTIDYENRDSGVKITDLKDGDYKLLELTAPAGYVKTNAEITFTVKDGVFTYTDTDTNSWTKIVKDEANNTFTLEVTVKNEPEHTYTITKVAMGNLDAKLTGAEFTIYEYHVNGEPTPVTTLTTDESGQIKIDDRTMTELSSGHAYYVQETKAPVGYVLPKNAPKYFFYFGTLPGDVAASTLAELSANKTVLNLHNGPQQLVLENTPEMTSVQVYKTWGSSQQFCPDETITEIRFKLIRETWQDGELLLSEQYPDAATLYTITKENWEKWERIKIKDLPTGDAVDGKSITYKYRVEELPVEGYKAYYSVTSDAIQIDNKPTPVSITVNKVWADGETGHNGVKVTLYYRDNYNQKQQEGQPVTLNADNNWTCTWDNLDAGTKENPKYYFVQEESVSGYETSYSVSPTEGIHGGKITVTNTKTVTGLAVKKQWQDENGDPLNADELKPITVKLYRMKGTPSGHAVTIMEYGDWNDSLQSTYVKYVVDGGSLTATVPGYHAFKDCIVTSGTATVTLNEGNTSCQISNIHGNITIALHRTYSKVSFPDYEEPPAEMHPETKELYETVTLSKENRWYISRSNLPKDAGDGSNWYYFVEEDPVTGYSVSYQNNGGVQEGTITVTNRKIPPIDFSFTKQWKNTTGGLAPWPETIEEIRVTLKRRLPDGTEDSSFVKSFALDNADTGGPVDGISWTCRYDSVTESYTYTFAPLESGYVYYIAETPPEHYTASYADENRHSLINVGYALNGQYIINTPEASVELPATGGPGTEGLRLAGAAVLGTGLGWGVRLRRKRERGDASG